MSWIIVLVTFVVLPTTLRSELIFPKNFYFGAGTSAFQTEGAWNKDGKTPSIWDYKVHNYPEQISDRSHGDIACDSYHKLQDDINILLELGVDVYRFSLSWTRILPNGFANYVNPAGISHYNTVINELLRVNITPIVTIYHWDLPQTFASLGGWTNPIIADYFADYADVVYRSFGDRVKFWTTLNEPHMFCEFDYIVTYQKMGIENPIAPYLCAHNALRAHAKAYHLYKNKYADQRGQVGITLDSQWYIPKSNNDVDKESAQRALAFDFDWFAHPIFSKHGDYPPKFKNHLEIISQQEHFPQSKLPKFTKDEIKEIRGSSDYFGLNHYNSYLISSGSHKMGDKPSIAKDLNVTRSFDPSWTITDIGWGVVPKGFYELIMYIKKEYNDPVMHITENGCTETPMDDKIRQQYLNDYLESMLDAIRDGANIKGYCAWTLMDNFEWFFGYEPKFGLYHVDFTDPNRTRTPRQSAFLYQKIIKEHKLRHLEEN